MNKTELIEKIAAGANAIFTFHIIFEIDSSHLICGDAETVN